MKNQKIIDCLEACGWFAEMPAEGAEKLKLRLEQDPYDVGYLNLASFDFDTEFLYACGETGELDSYTELLKELANISWGLFTPSNIRDEYDEATKVIHLGFDFGGQRFEEAMSVSSDWLADEFFVLVEKSLEANKILQRFVYVPDLDQIAYLAFISPETFEKARACGAIPSIDELIEESGF